MELNKIVPARRLTLRCRWCKHDWMPMSARYREIRAKHKSPMDACKWCTHKFADGEMMALAQPETGTNIVLCQTCAAEMIRETAK